MTIENFKNHGIPYLRLIASQGLKKVGGRTVQRRKLVKNLGPLSRFDDGQPDFLLRLRRSFREGRPIVKELEPYVGKPQDERVSVVFRQGDAKCLGEPKRLAPVVLDPVFRALGLDEFFASVKFASKIGYDLAGVVRLLTYGRLLEPASKSATMAQNGKYLRPLVSESYDGCVYDALDVVDANAGKIVRRMNSRLAKASGRDGGDRGGLLFYDVTNFYFEIPGPDEDVTDEAGNVVSKGLRKLGVSKENRKQPIVQLGLFLDGGGIPVSFGVFPGNTLDHHTLRPAMKETVDGLELKRFVLVADRGMYSGPNVLHVTDAGNGYIVSKSLRKSQRKEVDWALDAEGYDKPGADFRCKSRVVTRVAKVEEPDGRGGAKVGERRYREKVVVYWSKAYYERERRENKSFLEFVERLKANPAGFRVTAAQSRSLRRFLKKEVVDRESGEVLDGTKLAAMIDDEKLSAFNDLMGYYQIVTSELEMPDREVIDKYHGLTQIEDQFREMKSTLETRPVYVQTEAHVRAHLTICFVALTMLRLVQRRVKAALGPECGKGLDWTYGMPGERVARALADWQAVELPGDYYQMVNATGDDIRLLFRAFGIDVPAKIYTKGDIRALKSGVQTA